MTKPQTDREICSVLLCFGMYGSPSILLSEIGVGFVSWAWWSIPYVALSDWEVGVGIATQWSPSSSPPTNQTGLPPGYLIRHAELLTQNKLGCCVGVGYFWTEWATIIRFTMTRLGMMILKVSEIPIDDITTPNSSSDEKQGGRWVR